MSPELEQRIRVRVLSEGETRIKEARDRWNSYWNTDVRHPLHGSRSTLAREALMRAAVHLFDAVDECAELKRKLRTITNERDKLKTVPAKYRRMSFNAELQKENAKLEKNLTWVLAEIGAENPALKQDIEKVLNR